MGVVSSVLSDELEHYWRVMRAAPAQMSLTEYQDELEVLAMFTTSETLRAMCLKNLSRFDHLGSTVRVARAK